ncbi:bifunctional DNA-formamidopyrimidine glycosylase/DNA-(apurinic or apyrimidinic site) lyase [Gordonia sp. PP30]|uniref:bifunctional DNA-formamidopyrimidine glycosylase/DNA-(apurinic or apyrimidinic site) lyase n=1 Tax=Gordonia sp. PP30 TaxID=2935861 RepID=UPI001FFF8485|nr:bifunctional DNA-formamidopyrimidine glycosylase/DNA-(apurinic or apyrimidinic site) lyase [Gordonia sp. PP30]UQE76573.1 bifunctional DNA-formamidopyrimidine glycosylase/DNA-(apurinic or apyrimidinic site) lyase [Gordonia sp. PP30]
MPELPEVETIRMGLATHLTGRRFGDVAVLHPRAARRHLLGDDDLRNRLRGKMIRSVDRRGKYLWLTAADAADEVAVVVHLGMSGQMLMAESGAPDPVHLRIRADLDDGNELRFVDQRTFGGWHLDDLVDAGSRLVPESVAHIAPDPFEPAYDPDAVVAVLRRKDTEIKRALLDQTVVAGIGNIYADEALWRAQVHGRRRTRGLSRAKLHEVLFFAREVMSEAISVGGTSFDDLYVNVNGESGYFERALNAYGREGEPCARCGTPMVRESFMNRSSFFCPSCQRPPRRRV